jgi:hypothetical protein
VDVPSVVRTHSLEECGPDHMVMIAETIKPVRR